MAGGKEPPGSQWSQQLPCCFCSADQGQKGIKKLVLSLSAFLHVPATRIKQLLRAFLAAAVSVRIESQETRSAVGGDPVLANG